MTSASFFLYIFHFTVALLPFSNWSGHHYGSHFFHIFILWKNEKFASIFREKQRERKKSTSNNRLRYLCLKSSYCEKSWNFEKIITIFQSLARNEENLIFVFHPPPIFLWNTKNWKKRNFSNSGLLCHAIAYLHNIAAYYHCIGKNVFHSFQKGDIEIFYHHQKCQSYF